MVKVPVRSHYRVNSGALALAGARQGIGYAIWRPVPAEDLAAGRLVEVPLELRPAPCSCWPCMAIGIRPARVRTLLDLIKLRLDEMTPAQA